MDDTNDDSIPDIADLPAVADGEQDTTDWKAEALKAQETAKKVQGMAKRFKTKIDKLAAPKSDPAPGQQPAANQKKGFDYSEKAYLKSSGVASDDFDYTFEQMQATGKSLDELLDPSKPAGKIFAAELKERVEHRTTANAAPSGTKRAGNNTSNDVDYWLAKVNAGTATVGQIPDRALRIKVVNARIKSQQSGSVFGG